MKKWQESRNYRQVKNDAGEIISYIITVDGIDVEVPEDVYRAYSQADRRERYVREEMEAGKLLSLDKLLEDDVPLEPLGVDLVPSAEDTTLEQEESSETARQLKKLAEALSGLNTAERQLLQALYFEGIPAREYARQLGVYHRTVLYRRDKLLEKLSRMIFA